MATKPSAQRGVKKGNPPTSFGKGGSTKIPQPPLSKGAVKPSSVRLASKAAADKPTRVVKGAVKPSPVRKVASAKEAEVVTASIASVPVKPVRKTVKIPQPPYSAGADTPKRMVLTSPPQGILERSIVGRYFFLPTDFILLLWRALKFAVRNWWRVAIVATVAIVGWYGLGAGLEGMVFLGFLAAMFAWNLDGRVSIGAGLACLVLIVVMQALIQSGVLLLFETSTETVAVWAYYFLCIGVAKQLVDLVREGRSKNRPL